MWTTLCRLHQYARYYIQEILLWMSCSVWRDGNKDAQRHEPPSSLIGSEKANVKGNSLWSKYIFENKSSIFWVITLCSSLKVNWQLCLPSDFLLGLFLDPKDGGDMFLRNVCWLWTDYTALYRRDPQILHIFKKYFMWYFLLQWTSSLFIAGESLLLRSQSHPRFEAQSTARCGSYSTENTLRKQ
jgi:hypothetical protein